MAVDDPNHFDQLLILRMVDLVIGGTLLRLDIYNPSHDNYQISGNCRRYIGRALNVMNRLGVLIIKKRKAFKKASLKKNQFY